MKRHVPAPAKGHTKLLTYCGVPYEDRASPELVRQTLALAARDGRLKLFCDDCIAEVIAAALLPMVWGARGGQAAQAARSPAQRKELALKAAHALWSQKKAGLPTDAPPDLEPMRLGMAAPAEQDAVVGVRGTAAEAPGDDLMDMPDRPLRDPGASGV